MGVAQNMLLGIGDEDLVVDTTNSEDDEPLTMLVAKPIVEEDDELIEDEALGACDIPGDSVGPVLFNGRLGSCAHNGDHESNMVVMSIDDTMRTLAGDPNSAASSVSASFKRQRTGSCMIDQWKTAAVANAAAAQVAKDLKAVWWSFRPAVGGYLPPEVCHLPQVVDIGWPPECDAENYLQSVGPHEARRLQMPSPGLKDH